MKQYHIIFVGLTLSNTLLSNYISKVQQYQSRTSPQYHINTEGHCNSTTVL